MRSSFSHFCKTFFFERRYLFLILKYTSSYFYFFPIRLLEIFHDYFLNVKIRLPRQTLFQMMLSGRQEAEISGFHPCIFFPDLLEIFLQSIYCQHWGWFHWYALMWHLQGGGGHHTWVTPSNAFWPNLCPPGCPRPQCWERCSSVWTNIWLFCSHWGNCFFKEKIVFDQEGLKSPFRYCGLVAGPRSWILLLFSWILSFVVAGVTSMSDEPSVWYVCERTSNSSSSRIQFDLGDKYSMIIPSISYIVLFALPALLIALIYSRIYLEARANTQKMRRGSNSKLMNGPNPVEEMLRCSIKIATLQSANLDNLDEIVPLRSSGSFSEKFSKSTRLASNTLKTSIRHKISNASIFMQVCAHQFYKILGFQGITF